MAQCKELLSIPDTACLVGVSEREVRQAISDGDLEAEMVGAMWIVRREDALEWQEELAEEDSGADGAGGSQGDDPEDNEDS